MREDPEDTVNPRRERAVQRNLLLIGIDDTDNRESPMGTGKLVRLLWKHLEVRCPALRSQGVVRLQLLVDPRIPYTSHNSPACLILEAPPQRTPLAAITEAAHSFIREAAAEGSDPGVCIASLERISRRIIDFGLKTASKVVEREEAEGLADVEGIHLAALGGDGSGVIGALAAVGLTAQGSCGRYIEVSSLRDLGEWVTTGDLRGLGIEVVSTDREGKALDAWEKVNTGGWLRPRRIHSFPVVFVQESANGWICYDKKQRS